MALRLQTKLVMKTYLTILFFISFGIYSSAQKFITSGVIEFEVRKNVHKSIGDNEWFQQFKEKIPQFSTNYFDFIFDNNQSLYKFNRSGDKQKMHSFFSFEEENNVWYNDYNNMKFVHQKAIDDNYIISGDFKKLNWKLSPNDQRMIAGFNCRKATAVLYDSVYVFAYYTDEIAVSGGPMGLNGLPGMILGVTIPRLYTSWVATKLQLEIPAKTNIAAPTKGKKKTEDDMKKQLLEISKSWGKEGAKYFAPVLWRFFL